MSNSKKLSPKEIICKEVFEEMTGFWVDKDKHKKLFSGWPSSDDDSNILKYPNDYRQTLKKLLEEDNNRINNVTSINNDSNS